MTRCLSVALLAYLSWCMAADHFAHIGRWDIASRMCPWEMAYCENDSTMIIKSAWLHRGNPVSYQAPIAWLRQTGNHKVAAALVRIENRMDPFRLCN